MGGPRSRFASRRGWVLTFLALPLSSTAFRSTCPPGALRADLMKNPVDGFSAGLTDENNIYEWSVTVIGPPDTLYEGGFFTAILSFPRDYPQSPPVCKFKSEMWHPNVYPDGKVCISILHSPGDDPSGVSRRGGPLHTGRPSASIISMLPPTTRAPPTRTRPRREGRQGGLQEEVQRCVRRSQEC